MAVAIVTSRVKSRDTLRETAWVCLFSAVSIPGQVEGGLELSHGVRGGEREIGAHLAGRLPGLFTVGRLRDGLEHSQLAILDFDTDGIEHQDF